VTGFHLSTVDPATTVSLTRLDREPGDAIDWRISPSDAELGVQELDLGSALLIDVTQGLLAPEDWGLDFEFRLTAMPHHRVLLAANGFTLGFADKSLLYLRNSRGDNDTALLPMPVCQWLRLALRCRDGRCIVSVHGHSDAAVITRLEVAFPPSAPHEIVIGASPVEDVRTLDVAIGRIVLTRRETEVASFHMPAVGRPSRVNPAAGSGGVLHIRNALTFAVRSARWDGTQDDPCQAPAHYDAVALHDDDLGDAAWPVTHRIAVPADAESGVYGLTVQAAGHATTWPFFVTPRRRDADLLFLAPSFTYLAYADERLPEDRFPWQCDDAGHRFAAANGLTSLYDVHNDGTGVSLASFHRPLATIRDDYVYPLCGAPHLLPVDLHLLRFLAAQGIRVDLITDAELHRDGIAALGGYRGVITGSHPEYWTGATLDAVSSFQESGGHLAYLGGNGCYWVTACDGDTIEVRRGESGIRTWSSEPGESHLAMTGEPGGLWRHAGRPEHQLLGVGLAAMGFTRSRPFHRTPESYSADLAWLFDGVGDAPIGTEGMMLGGASGYEIDCRSAAWGTPAETVLLAVADGFDAAFEADPTAEVPYNSEERMPPIHGEMTLTRRGNGAMTFAAGSVAWCGALPHAQRMNPVGLITRNLLRRFIA
jgi:N,N-dimethylformamidase